MSSAFQLEMQGKVLDLLGTKPRTLPQLTNSIRGNYYSVRLAVRTLQDEGKVKEIPSTNARNRKYTLGEDALVNNSIPHIIVKGQRIKLDQAMNITPQSSIDAVARLPQHITNIFRLAEIAATNEDITMRLDMLKSRMESDIDTLHNVIEIYAQILKNNRNWSPTTLRRYPDDAEFNQSVYQEKFFEFFGEE